jgi:predicted GNAT family N-acyltransferase
MDSLALERYGRRLVVFSPSGRTIDEFAERAKRDIPGLAGASVVHRVISHNPDAIWGISRQQGFDTRRPIAEGFIAFLMLNREGLRQLAEGTLDGADPDLSLLVRQNEKPAGIYVWMVYAPGPLAAGVPLVLQKISTPLYGDVDLYARAVTADGHRFVESVGFHPGTVIDGISAPHLYRYSRGKKPGEAPAYDTAGGRAKRISITTARSFEDLFRVVSIRGAVYMAEQECPYEEEFDGNDLAATHLLCYLDDEPVGCIRVRCFADFAKIERLAVRKEFRGHNLARDLARAAIELCRAKGYRRLYGHSARHMVGFWSQFGFRVVEGSSAFVFSDFEYVELVGDFERSPDAISLGIDPYVLIRPEGRWHAPGVLERSAKRGVTRPSVDGTRT